MVLVIRVVIIELCYVRVRVCDR